MSRDLRITILTCAAVAVAIGVRWLLGMEMGELAPFSPFYIAVVIGAWLGGSRPALLATALSLLAYALFFADHVYAAGLNDTIISLVMILSVCSSIAYFGGVLHREKHRAMDHADRLQLAEERSSRAQLAAKVGVWEIDMIRGTNHFSTEFREIHRIGHGPFDLEKWFAMLHPDDERAARERLEQVLKQRSPEWISRDRWLHPESGVRWTFSRARITYDQQGRPVRISGTTTDITDQQEAQSLLHRSEERSSRAQEVAQAGTWELDLVQQMAYPSREYCRLVDIPYRSAMPLEETFLFSHADDRAAVRQGFQDAVRSKQRSYQSETRHVLPDGRVKWRMSRGEVQYDDRGEAISVLGATIDVTDRKLAELALQRSEERFRLATEAFNGMIYDHDRITGVVQRSKGLKELIGPAPEQVPATEQFWTDRIHPDDVIGVKALMGSVIEERSPLYDLEYRVRHDQGHWVWVNDKGRLSYDDKGGAVRAVGSTTDITVRKKAEEELQLADRRKDDFMATLAHELRNPLSPLQHAIDLLEDVGQDQEMMAELRAMMARQMKHLVRLVDDLLDLSRINRGKIELRRRPIDLVNCLKAALEANRHTMDRLKHELRVSLPEKPCMVYGDGERLTQVVNNLLNNAAKFTPSQGVIELSLAVEDKVAVLSVKDNGNGLDKGATERIFEMFVQAGTSTQGGLGIGLNLVRRLVVMHGGSVNAHSDGPGKGSLFTVRLPVFIISGEGPRSGVDRSISDRIEIGPEA